MGSIGRDVATHFFEVQAVDAVQIVSSVSQRLKRRKRMPAAFETLWPEALGAAVMWPSLPRSAQPVVVPRSRGEGWWWSWCWSLFGADLTQLTRDETGSMRRAHAHAYRALCANCVSCVRLLGFHRVSCPRGV